MRGLGPEPPTPACTAGWAGAGGNLQVRSLRCGFVDAIAAMLAEDPRVPATVIAQRLRLQGFAGSVTILKDQST